MIADFGAAGGNNRFSGGIRVLELKKVPVLNTVTTKYFWSYL